MLNKLFSLFLLTLGWSVISAYSQITPVPQNLESGQLIERQLAGGESHTYQINLTAGQFMRVVVEQKGIDVALQMMSSDGKPLIEASGYLADLPDHRAQTCGKRGYSGSSRKKRRRSIHPRFTATSERIHGPV